MRRALLLLLLSVGCTQTPEEAATQSVVRVGNGLGFAGGVAIAEGSTEAPSLAPGEVGEFEIDVPRREREAGIEYHLTVRLRSSEEEPLLGAGRLVDQPRRPTVVEPDLTHLPLERLHGDALPGLAAAHGG